MTVKACWALLLPVAILFAGCGQKTMSLPDPLRISIRRLEERERALAEPATSILPLRIEIRCVGKGDSLPKTELHVSEHSVRLTLLETSPPEEIVTYETSIEDTGIAQVLAAYTSNDFRGAYSISNPLVRDGSYIALATPSCYYRFYLSDDSELPKEFVKFLPLLQAARDIIRKRKSYRIIKTEVHQPRRHNPRVQRTRPAGEWLQ